MLPFRWYSEFCFQMNYISIRWTSLFYLFSLLSCRKYVFSLFYYLSAFPNSSIILENFEFICIEFFFPSFASLFPWVWIVSSIGFAKRNTSVAWEYFKCLTILLSEFILSRSFYYICFSVMWFLWHSDCIATKLGKIFILIFKDLTLSHLGFARNHIHTYCGLRYGFLTRSCDLCEVKGLKLCFTGRL